MPYDREAGIRAKEAFLKQVEDSVEFKILEQVANEASVTPQDAVQKIIDMSMTAFIAHGVSGPNTISHIDYNVSLALIELAQRLEPSKHRKLVEFITTLQKHTAKDPTTGEPLKTQGDTLWTSLPSLGYTELEEWYEFGGDYTDPCDSSGEPKYKRRWTNLNAFLSQLSQAAEFRYTAPDEPLNNHPLDFSLRAVWTMQFALENEKYSPNTLGSTAAIQAACAWFAYGADRLWANVRNKRTYPEASGAGPGSKYSSKGWRGYEPERWDAWRRNLEESGAACHDEVVKQLIEGALTNIDRATKASV